MDRQSAMALEPNREHQLPIQLLCHAGTDDDGPERLETIWRLLLACPEIVSQGASHDGKTLTRQDGHPLRASARSSKEKCGGAYKKSQFTKHFYANMLLQLSGKA